MVESDVYQQVIDRFADDCGVEPVPPAIKIDLFRIGVEADPDTYTLEMGVIPYTRMERDVFQDMVYDALHDLYNAALETAVNEHCDALEDLYAPFDPGFTLETQCFADLSPDDDEETEDYSKGEYLRHRGCIRIDATHMENVDPKRQTVESKMLDRLLRHECVHAMHYGTNPHIWTLREHISDTTDDSHTDVRRASIEAITTFEQYRIHGQDKNWERRFRRLRDPWQVPDVFMEHTDMDEYGDSLFDNPYRLGHFTAHAVDAAFQEVYSEEDGRELTREFLLHGVTTPTGLVGAIESSFDLRGLPYYPDRVQTWEDWLSQQDHPEEQVEEMYDAGMALLEDVDTEQAQLTCFYELHALLHAADEDWIADDMLQQVEERL